MKQGIKIGHVHLKVSNLERAVDFYTRALGMEVSCRYGSGAAFLSYDGYHHHLGLNTWESQGGTSPPGGHTGLYHFALLFPTLPKLEEAILTMVREGARLKGASDHGVSLAAYFRDPDENGIELYWDRHPDQWPRTEQGEIVMKTEPWKPESLTSLTS